MTDVLYILLAGLIGYLFGSIPFGYLFVKAVKNIDLREVGSGRTGGTNSLRAAGPVVGVITALSDVLKGAIAIIIARTVFGNVLGATLLPWAEVICGAFAVIGHNWSLFLAFKGGAGTGPNVGWAAAVWPPMFPIAFVTMVVLLLGVGMASVASLVMAAIIPLTFTVRYLSHIDPTPAYMVGGIITALIVAWSLRPNIKRIIEGTERVVGPARNRRKK